MENNKIYFLYLVTVYSAKANARLANSIFTLDTSRSRLTMVRNRFVSSANIINLNISDDVIISLIYSKKSKGLSIEPCGTPHMINT